MDTQGSTSPFRLKYIILFGVVILVIALDQLTKYWILAEFRLGQTIPVISNFFNITYVQNRGAAFGLLSRADPSFRIPFFIIVPLIALGTIGYAFKKLRDSDVKLSIALSLVIGGAIGNLIDRLLLGHVVDFLDFHWKWEYHFPAFNIADSAICVGVAIVMLDLLFQDHNTLQTKESQSHVSSAP